MNSRLVVLVMIPLAAVVPSLVASTIHSYTGNGFTFPSGALTTSDFISLSLTFSSPLPPNEMLEFESGCGTSCNASQFFVPTDWSMSDGIITFSPTTPDAYILGLLNTDSSGDVVGWEICGGIPWGNCGNNNVMITENIDGYALDDVVFSDAAGESVSNPGTWSIISDVPEPAIWKMLAFVIGMALVRLSVGQFRLTREQNRSRSTTRQ